MDFYPAMIENTSTYYKFPTRTEGRTLQDIRLSTQMLNLVSKARSGTPCGNYGVLLDLRLKSVFCSLYDILNNWSESFLGGKS